MTWTASPLLNYYNFWRKELPEKFALVTGGSYGIGFSIACNRANAGAKVVFNR